MRIYISVGPNWLLRQRCIHFWRRVPTYVLDLWLRMENESRNSEEQSRKLIRIKNQWFVSTESESDSDDSVMIRIRIDTCNTYSTIETWPDSWHSVSDHGHLSPAVRTSGSRNLVGLQWHSLYQHVIWWRRSLSCYLARLRRLCWRTPGVPQRYAPV